MRSLALVALILLVGSLLPAEATSVKGGLPPADADGSTVVQQRLSRLKEAAQLFDRVSQKVSRQSLPAEAKSYSRWLRIYSARMKEVALRWSSRLDRSAMSSGQRVKLNKAYHLQCDQLQEQMRREHTQFKPLEKTIPKNYAQVDQAIRRLE